MIYEAKVKREDAVVGGGDKIRSIPGNSHRQSNNIALLSNLQLSSAERTDVLGFLTIM